MSEKYEHDGRHLTTQIAMELIFKTHVWKPPVESKQSVKKSI